MKCALVLGMTVFGAGCDDGDGGGDGGAGQGGGGGQGGGQQQCGNSGDGTSICNGEMCQAGNYCGDFGCTPGCTADANCGNGEQCVRGAGEAVGVCSPCMSGQGGAGGGAGGQGGQGGGGDDCEAFCNKSEQCSNGQVTAAMCIGGGFCNAVPSACRTCIINSDCGDINNAGACDAACNGGGEGGAGGGDLCAINCDIDADCDTNNCVNNCCECTFAGCPCEIDADCDTNNCFQGECQL